MVTGKNSSGQIINPGQTLTRDEALRLTQRRTAGSSRKKTSSDRSKRASLPTWSCRATTTSAFRMNRSRSWGRSSQLSAAMSSTTPVYCACRIVRELHIGGYRYRRDPARAFRFAPFSADHDRPATSGRSVSSPKTDAHQQWAPPGAHNKCSIAARHAHPTLPLQCDRTAWYGSGVYPSGYGHGRCCSQ